VHAPKETHGHRKWVSVMRVKLVPFVAGTFAVVLAWPADARPSPGKKLVVSSVEQIDYQRCWTRSGKRHCRLVRGNGGSRGDNAIPAYGANRADNHRVGTAEWYRAMERDGRLGTEGGSP
jgi:hypothetical protein